MHSPPMLYAQFTLSRGVIQYDYQPAFPIPSHSLRTGCASRVQDGPGFEVVAMGVSRFELQRVEQSL